MDPTGWLAASRYPPADTNHSLRVRLESGAAQCFGGVGAYLRMSVPNQPTQHRDVSARVGGQSDAHPVVLVVGEDQRHLRRAGRVRCDRAARQVVAVDGEPTQHQRLAVRVRCRAGAHIPVGFAAETNEHIQRTRRVGRRDRSQHRTRQRRASSLRVSPATVTLAVDLMVGVCAEALQHRQRTRRHWRGRLCVCREQKPVRVTGSALCVSSLRVRGTGFAERIAGLGPRVIPACAGTVQPPQPGVRYSRVIPACTGNRLGTSNRV